MKTIEEIVGKNIRERRKQLGLSQAQLAKNAGLFETTINRYEAGIQPPRKANLEAVAKALGCTREDLLADTAKIQTTPTIKELLAALSEMEKELSSLKKTMKVIPANILEYASSHAIDPKLWKLAEVLLGMRPAAKKSSRETG